METNKTLSRSTLTVQDVTVDEAMKPILPSIDTPRCDLRPSPGTTTEVANEEKRKVFLHWGDYSPYRLMEPCYMYYLMGV